MKQFPAQGKRSTHAHSELRNSGLDGTAMTRIRIFVTAVLVAFASFMPGMAMPEAQIDITAKGPDGLPGIFWLINQRDPAAVGA